MFKRKTQVFILIFFIIAFIATFSFATEPATTSESPVGDSTVTTDNAEENQEPETTESNDIKEVNDDLYLFGEEVVVDQYVNGNVYVMGNKVSVTGKINGNLFAFAQNFSLDNAYVTNSIFLCASNASFNGACTDLYAACNKLDVTYESYIARDSRITCEELIFKALNSRNMFIQASKIDFGSDSETATIYGNLNYTSSEELSLAEGTVSGEVKYDPQEIKDAKTTTDFVSIFTSILSTLVYSIVVYYMIRWFTPTFQKGVSEYASKKFIFAFLIGLISLIIIPIISILLLFSSIAGGLSVALFTVYALLVSISFAVFSLFITKLLEKKFNKIPEIGLFAIVTIVLALLRIAPYVPFIVSFIMGISGFGMIIMSLFKKATTNPTVIETTTVKNTTDSSKE